MDRVRPVFLVIRAVPSCVAATLARKEGSANIECCAMNPMAHCPVCLNFSAHVRLPMTYFAVTGLPTDPFNPTGAEAGLSPVNCVIEECRIDLPGGTTTTGTIGLQFAITGLAPSLGCVMRECVIDLGNSASNYTGIVAGGGRATVVEENFVRNCRIGFSVCAGKTWDMVVRRNQFSAVESGIKSIHSSTDWLGQFVALHNRMEISGTGARTGILFNSDSVGLALGPVILRHNIIGRADTPNSGDIGVSLTRIANAIVERNIIDVTTKDNSIRFDSCTNKKTFSNRKKDSTLLPGYDATVSRHTEEWELETENMLML
jgi:hypothetical protein